MATRIEPVCTPPGAGYKADALVQVAPGGGKVRLMDRITYDSGNVIYQLGAGAPAVLGVSGWRGEGIDEALWNRALAEA